MLRFYKYSGAGNRFVVIDGRIMDASRFKRPDVVHALCLQNGTDGLMILENSQEADFRMEFFNPDGSSGMMCGNGGRCIVAFADLLGVKPFHSREYVFIAPDGLHRAEILAHMGEAKTVRLGMHDVAGATPQPEGYFLDTGARHLVTFVPDARTVDVASEGARLRRDPRFAPQGTNVDFVSVDPDGSLRVRTFEKGVEGETLACGTGITASAMAACLHGIPPGSEEDGVLRYTLHACQDDLEVDFRRSGEGFSEVHLTGPTLCEGDISEE